MLLVNFDGGVVETPMDEWKPEEVAARVSPGAAGRPRGRTGALPRRGRADGEPTGAALPDDAGGAAQRQLTAVLS